METIRKISVEDVLRETDLSGADLSGLSLGCKDLRGKNFRGADLSFAHLGVADLQGADMRNANLLRANLGAANLSGADFRYANLHGANLLGALTNGTDFRESTGFEPGQSQEAGHLLRPVKLEETPDFNQAKADGFFPLTHWGHEYAIDGGQTLYKHLPIWSRIKHQLGNSIFSEGKHYSEVKLVQQYQEYSQWAYMLSREGFERITRALGLKLHRKE